MADASTGTTAKFDVVAFAQNILKEVDSKRAFEEATDEKTKEGFTLSMESRINAFFRLIGLPMFVTLSTKDETESPSGDLEGKTHITPGYSQSFSRKLSEYDISNSEDVRSDLKKREEELLKIERNVGTSDMNSNMTKAMKYLLPLTANIPDDEGKLSNKVGQGSDTRSVFKKLKPLMTAYIGSGIKPFRNEMARPFLRDPKEQLVDTETTLPKPFIETVIRTRLVSCGGGGTAKQQSNKQSFYDSLQEYVGEDEFGGIFKDNLALFTSSDLLESFIVMRLFNSLSELAKQWVEIQKIQERLAREVTFNISIKTTSSKQSPFGKRTEITADALMVESSKIGNELKDLRKKQVKQEALLSLLPTDDVVTDDSNSKTKNTQNVALSALVTPFATLISGGLSQTLKRISEIEGDLKKKGQQIEQLRLRTEMMTGEFTGLSVPDVVIVITALFMIDKKDLIMLLDAHSIEEMKRDSVLNSALSSLGVGTSSAADAKKAVGKLEALVDQLYDFLDSEIAKCKDRPSRNRKITKKRTGKTQ